MSYIKKDMTWLAWFTRPVASQSSTSTYTIGANSNGDMVATKYVHATGAVTSYTLSSGFEEDDHAPCAIIVRQDSKVQAFYAEHTGSDEDLRTRISASADAIDFGSETSILEEPEDGAWSYAQVEYLSGEGTSGRWYLFTRNTATASAVRWCFIYSDDDGDTWSEPVELLKCSNGTNIPYPVFRGNGVDRIEVAASVAVKTGGTPVPHEGVYHAYFANGELFKSDGTSIGTEGAGLPATLETDLTQIYDSTSADDAWVMDVIPNGGNPVVMWCQYPTVGTDHDYYEAVWDDVGEDWDDVTKIVDAGGAIVDTSANVEHSYPGLACFDGDDPDAIFASIGDWTTGTRIVRMTKSGGSWSEDYTVVGSIGRKVANIRPVVPYNGDSGQTAANRACYLLWNQGQYGGGSVGYEDYDTDVCFAHDALAVSEFSHRIKLTVASGKATGSADVNGMQMLIVTHANLTGSNSTTFWANVQNGGADIRASADIADNGGLGQDDALRPLPVDVLYCDTSTEKLKLRVFVPETQVGTEIYLWFGSSSVSANTNYIGTDAYGFPGSKAVYPRSLVAIAPDFTTTSGSIPDRGDSGISLSVAGSPTYAQTDEWGGPGAMVFDGDNGDMLYYDDVLGRCGIVWIEPDLGGTTETSEFWWLFHGTNTGTVPYFRAWITDTSAPNDSNVGAGITGGNGGLATDNEASTGFSQHHARMQINGGPSRAVQVNNRTEVTAANKSASPIDTFSIGGLRRNSMSNTVRSAGTIHDMIVFTVYNGSPYLDTDACDTYWANYGDPASFWTTGTVEEVGAAAPDLTTGVEFDGSSDELSRGADLTGNADGKEGLVSVWFKIDTQKNQYFMKSGGGSQFRVRLLSDGSIDIVGRQPVTFLNRVVLKSSASTVSTGQWYHLLASWDTANTTSHLYLNGVDVKDSGASSIFDGNIDYTDSDFDVGTDFDGCMGEVYFSLEYLDLSSSSNREKFIASGNPVSLGSDGSTPTGSQPIVYLSGGVDQFEDNFGSGGSFTEQGGSPGLQDCEIPTFVTAALSLSAAIAEQRMVAAAVGAAIAVEQEASVSLQAAIAAALSATTELQAAVQEQKTASAALGAMVQAGSTASTSLDAAISAQRTASASLSSAIAAERAASSSLDAAIAQAMTASAVLSAAIQTTGTASAALGAFIEVEGEGSASVSLQAAILEAKTAAVSLGAAISLSRTASASLGAYIQADTSVVASLDAAIQATSTATASLQAAIATAGTVSASLGAVVATASTVSASLEAAVRAEVTAAASLSAYISTLGGFSPSSLRTQTPAARIRRH